MVNRKITILGIETSCDETAAAVLKISNQKIVSRSNVVSSQVKIHAQYGGIVPEVAARKHAEQIIFVLQKALKSSAQGGSAPGGKKFNLKSVNAIAVTSGPGLITSLLIGVEAAKTLAFVAKKPLIPVNHLAGHIYANFIDQQLTTNNQQLTTGRSCKSTVASRQLFPAVCLIVSGGHTELVLMKDFEKFKKIGQTLDDAAGECFDKVAKILGLGYPGGPAVAAEAAKLPITNYPAIAGPRLGGGQLPICLPRPMINSGDFNFSFSGLKTAVLYKAQKMSKVEIKNNLAEICAEFQQAVIDVLIAKTIDAARQFKVKSIILGGGVVANRELRKQFQATVKEKIPEAKLLIPNLKYTTDNAAMIAATGYFKLMKAPRSQWYKKFDWRRIKVDPNLEI